MNEVHKTSETVNLLVIDIMQKQIDLLNKETSLLIDIVADHEESIQKMSERINELEKRL